MNNDGAFLRSSGSARSALMMIVACVARYAMMNRPVELSWARKTRPWSGEVRLPAAYGPGVHPFMKNRRRKFKGWQRERRRRGR